MVLAARPRLVVLAAVLGAVALVAALLLVAGPGPGGPELAAPGGHFSVSAAASANGPVDVGRGTAVGADQHHDRSLPLRQQTQYPVVALPADAEQDASGPAHPVVTGRDPVVQSTIATPAMPAAALNFEGIDFPGVSCNCAPPDTNGQAGATQYVQIVNEGFQVWNKSTGASVYGPVGITTVWSGFGGACQSNGDGDPVVLWDQIAGRWLISQFAGATVPTDECIAVSTTSDATGAYNRYDFHLGSNFYDYPHLAVWPDGYYMTDNVFNSSGTSYLGPQPFVFDRSSMLAGATATFQTLSAGPLGSSMDPILPADLDGSNMPPAGAPESFVRFPGGGAYQTFHYHVDWVTPTNTTWTTFASPAAAGFSQLCSGTRACVPQLGSTSNLDGIADRLMFRLAYRHFSDHESLVGNYTVASGGVAGIRWFELRGVTVGPETVFQESTYQPDSTWRWMGSAAMDQVGDLAIGFSASSSSIFPQLRYAGRLVGDPLNTLAQGEATLFSGTGSQTGTSNRWGDYSDLTVDPVDGCTFWYTSEYYSSTTSFNWRTRIGSFSFPTCGGTPPPTGSIAGHVRDSSTTAAIAGATVSISGGPSTTTDGTGAYTFSGLTPATYSVTASASGYATSAPANVTVTALVTTTQDFALAPILTTGWFFPTAETAVTTGAGDNNGYEGNPGNLGLTGNNFATDANSGTRNSLVCTSTARDKEDTSGYSVSGPGTGSTILGLQVRLVGFVSAAKSSPEFCVQLSSDSGATWTAGKTTSVLSTTPTTYTLGSTSDTWGRTWTAGQLSSPNLVVRIIDLANSTTRTFSLNSVSVSVTYQ